MTTVSPKAGKDGPRRKRMENSAFLERKDANME